VNFGKLRIKATFSETALAKSLGLLTPNDKRKVYLVCLIQTFLGFLDLAAVAIFGILGALTISGIESSAPGNKVNTVLTILRIEHFTFQQQASVLGLIAITLLISKTLFSMYLTKKTLYFLSFRSADSKAPNTGNCLRSHNWNFDSHFGCYWFHGFVDFRFIPACSDVFGSLYFRSNSRSNDRCTFFLDCTYNLSTLEQTCERFRI
jgi:hypothetical protein